MRLYISRVWGAAETLALMRHPHSDGSTCWPEAEPGWREPGFLRMGPQWGLQQAEQWHKHPLCPATQHLPAPLGLVPFHAATLVFRKAKHPVWWSCGRGEEEGDGMERKWQTQRDMGTNRMMGLCERRIIVQLDYFALFSYKRWPIDRHCSSCACLEKIGGEEVCIEVRIWGYWTRKWRVTGKK